MAAVQTWGDHMERMVVRPAHVDGYEHVFHESGIEAFLLPLRDPLRPALRAEFEEPRLERAIGVFYQPNTELQSHYFYASLPQQFDEFIWSDETRGVDPLKEPADGETALIGAHPFGR